MSNAFRPLPFVLRQTFCLTLFSSLLLIQSFQHPLCIVVPTKPICLIWFVKPFDLPCNIVLFFSIFFFLFLQFSRRLFVRFATFLPVLAAFSTAVFCLSFFLARVRYFFRNGICLCSLRFPHVYLPAFAVFSAAVFFLFFFVTLIAVFYTCVLIVFCFPQRCFAIFDFLFSKIKKSLEILTKTFDIA